MKKIALSAITLIAFNLGMKAQNVDQLDSGTINSANYKIIFPENYQNKLVMFAHGYAAPG